MNWTPDSRDLFLQQTNRLQNAYKVLLADPANGSMRLLFTERDAAWVDPNPDPTWLSNGRAFTWLSERDGWRHLCVASADERRMQLRTPGKFDVIDLLLVDPKNGWAWFTAAPDDPTRRYLYRASLSGKPTVKRMTPAGQVGTHNYNIAPGGLYARNTVSTADAAPVTDMVNLTTQASIRVLARNAAMNAVLGQEGLAKTEFLRLDIGGGVTLDARMLKPKDFDPAKHYPILFYIYGEPGAQIVADRFDWFTIWHRMLAERDYIIASIDPRGTASPRGRAWRKASTARWGRSPRPTSRRGYGVCWPTISYIDPARVSIWGWSGGGSMTLNALFRSPDLYKTGIAVAAVADQKLYDTIYQERFMGLPQDNPRAVTTARRSTSRRTSRVIC